MAENAVELDTDGIEEKEISVEQVDKDEKLEVGEVDLGYTDTIKSDTKAKIVKTESGEDDLTEHSDNVQKRINGLTRRMREAERRERAALDFAKGLQHKFSKTESALQKTDQEFVNEYENRVDVETDKVKTQLKSAMQEQDYDKMMEANQNLTRLAVEKEKAKMRKVEIEEQSKNTEVSREQEQQVIPQEPSSRAKDWADTNSWFGQDKVMTNAAYTIHSDLVQKGFDPESEDYYTEIDKQLQDNFPGKFAKEKPIQTVASAGRKQQGRRKVTLTRSQVAIAKKLGVPLEEYAKYVKE